MWGVTYWSLAENKGIESLQNIVPYSLLRGNKVRFGHQDAGPAALPSEVAFGQETPD